MEDLGAHLQRLSKSESPVGHDHELLDVNVVIGVGPTVKDVHHRNREHTGAYPTQIAVERGSSGISRRPSGRQRYPQHRIGP